MTTTPTAHAFSSRYGQYRSITPLRPSGGTRQYIIEGDTHYTRGGEGMIDFEGGPFVCTGEFLNPDDPYPVRLREALPGFEWIGSDEVVVGAEWITEQRARELQGREWVPGRVEYAYALVTTSSEEGEEANANNKTWRVSDGE